MADEEPVRLNKFIADCGEYARKLDAICAEAAVILSNLEK